MKTPSSLFILVLVTAFSSWLVLRPLPPEKELARALWAARHGQTHGRVSPAALKFLLSKLDPEQQRKAANIL